MNIELTPERLAALAKEAEIRNATLEEGAPPHTAESIAQNLLDKACDSYAKTQTSATLAELAPVGLQFIAAPQHKRDAALAALQ